MKSRLLITIVIIFSLTLWATNSMAGNLLYGGKYWYASWDSAILDWFERDLRAGFKVQGVGLRSDIDPGSGHLTGPLLGYQTDDGAWAFSLAPMFVSSFSQHWTGSSEMMSLNTEVDTNRMDFDFALTHSLAKHRDKFFLFEYTKIFAGYKFQTVEYDLTLMYDTFLAPREFNYELDAQVHMPTIGLGFVFPVMRRFALGLQAGVGLALIDLEMKDPDGATFDISPDTSFAYNGEITITYVPADHFFIQLGYRAQLWYLKARSPQWWEETTSRDLTHGPTLTAVIVF